MLDRKPDRRTVSAIWVFRDGGVAPRATNYGENISTMAITKVFLHTDARGSPRSSRSSSASSPRSSALFYGIPLAVIGRLGKSTCFGAIAAQGIAIMIDHKVDMFLREKYRSHRFHHGHRYWRQLRFRRQHSLLRRSKSPVLLARRSSASC